MPLSGTELRNRKDKWSLEDYLDQWKGRVRAPIDPDAPKKDRTIPVEQTLEYSLQVIRKVFTR